MGHGNAILKVTDLVFSPATAIWQFNVHRYTFKLSMFVAKGDNFCNFLFASLEDQALPK